MDCVNCELSKLKFYCENCLKNHLHDFKAAEEHVTKEKNAQILKVKKALEGMHPARIRRATQASSLNRIAHTREELQRIQALNSQTQVNLDELRSNLKFRKKRLEEARSLPPSPPNDPDFIRMSIETLQKASMDLSLALSRARAGLVQELVEVFDIVEVGGRPSLGGKHGVKGEWRISGGVLPVPGDVRRYPPEQINATIQHSLHFLSILTYYLGIKLPFEIFWSESGVIPGVGHPFISAGKGSEYGGWAKWTDEQPLNLIPQQSTDKDKEKEKQDQSFTTAFAMLIYNVAYLAHTQGVEVPLSQSGDVLRNLWAVCCSIDLGKKSHAALNQPLSLPTPPTFTLDFTQLLQATMTTPPARTRHGHHRPKSKMPQETILEEDGEWDLV